MPASNLALISVLMVISFLLVWIRNRIWSLFTKGGSVLLQHCYACNLHSVLTAANKQTKKERIIYFTFNCDYLGWLIRLFDLLYNISSTHYIQRVWSSGVPMQLDKHIWCMSMLLRRNPFHRQRYIFSNCKSRELKQNRWPFTFCSHLHECKPISFVFGNTLQ